MYEPFPSISKVHALVLQEESHKNIGHGGSFAAKPNSIAMYVNSKGIMLVKLIGARETIKRKDLYINTALCLGTPLTSAISFMDIHPGTS